MTATTSITGWKDVPLSRQLVDAVTHPSPGLVSSTDEVPAATAWLKGILRSFGVDAQSVEAEVRYFPKGQTATLSLRFFTDQAKFVTAEIDGLDLRDADLSFNATHATSALLLAYAKAILRRTMESVPGAKGIIDVSPGVMGSPPDARITLHFTSRNKTFRYVLGRGRPDESESVSPANWNAAIPLLRRGKMLPESQLFSAARKIVADVVAKNAALDNPRVDALWGHTIEDTFEPGGR